MSSKLRLGDILNAQALVSYIIFVYYLRPPTKKGPYRFRIGCFSWQSEKMF